MSLCFETIQTETSDLKKFFLNTHQDEHLFSIDYSCAFGLELVTLTFYFKGVTSQSLDNFNYYDKNFVKEENSSLKKDPTWQVN